MALRVSTPQHGVIYRGQRRNASTPLRSRTTTADPDASLPPAATRVIAVPVLGVVAFPGIPEAAPGARRYVRSVLEPYGVDADDAETAVNELFSNAITHSRSRGGIVGVSVFDTGTMFRVEVIDQGCDHGAPAVRDAAAGEESGRGLRMVAGYTAGWGWERRRGRGCDLTVVWFEMAAGDRI